MMLHLVNSANAHNSRLNTCLDSLKAGDSVLFLTSQANFWNDDSAALTTIRRLAASQSNQFYLLADPEFSAIAEKAGVNSVSYLEWISLTEHHPHIQSWF